MGFSTCEYARPRSIVINAMMSRTAVVCTSLKNGGTANGGRAWPPGGGRSGKPSGNGKPEYGISFHSVA